jgi:hypothetical protein
VKPPSPAPSNDNNNWKLSSSKEEELKREEALVEDEMKEEEEADDDDDDDVEVDGRTSAPAVNFGIAETLKRHFENSDKLAMIKSMMEKPQVHIYIHMSWMYVIEILVLERICLSCSCKHFGRKKPL